MVYGVRNSGGEDLPGSVGPVAGVLAARDLIFLAVPAGSAVAALTAMGDGSGKTVVDCTNRLR